MKKRRWMLLGFNLVLATAILVQPGAAARGCEETPRECVCACLAEWDECDENGGKNCDDVFDRCLEKAKCPLLW